MIMSNAREVTSMSASFLEETYTLPWAGRNEKCGKRTTAAPETCAKGKEKGTTQGRGPLVCWSRRV